MLEEASSLQEKVFREKSRRIPKETETYRKVAARFGDTKLALLRLGLPFTT